jgi:(2R)-3-sulfolactate dehydrogenase (NADP+)
MRATFGAARRLAADLLGSAGMPAEPAERTAWILAAAEAWGRGSHGLLRLPFYLGRFDAGGADAGAELTPVRDGGATLTLDGHNGLGHWQVWRAAEVAAERAGTSGIAAVAVGNSGHCGALGLHLLPIVGSGRAGLVLSHGPAVIPPWGGSRPVTSTSPLAFGVTAGDRPVIVDLACSAAARGKIAEAAGAGRPVPEGWALDRHGRPTTDPAEALAGMLAPLGGAKGFALALAVEVLTAGLVGPVLSALVADPLDPAAAGSAQRIAHLVVAVDPAAVDFDGRGAERRAELAASVVEAGGRVPGADHPLPEELTDDHRLDLPDPVVARLRDEAARRRVAWPSAWD